MSSTDIAPDDSDVLIPDEGVYGDGYPPVRVDFDEQIRVLNKNYKPIDERNRQIAAAFEAQAAEEKKALTSLRNALDGVPRDPSEFPSPKDLQIYLRSILNRNVPAEAPDDEGTIPNVNS
jgi:hypothetical protein